MTPPIRVANETRSFAPHLVLTGGAPNAPVTSRPAYDTPPPAQFGDLNRNLATPRKGHAR